MQRTVDILEGMIWAAEPAVLFTAIDVGAGKLADILAITITRHGLVWEASADCAILTQIAACCPSAATAYRELKYDARHVRLLAAVACMAMGGVRFTVRKTHVTITLKK